MGDPRSIEIQLTVLRRQSANTGRSQSVLNLPPSGLVVKGKYKPDSDRFTAGLKAAFGSYRMSEERRDDGLHVHSERTNGRYSYDTAYQFVPL